MSVASPGAMTWEEAVRWLREQPGQEDLVKACYFDDPVLDAAERFWRGSEWSALRKLLPGVPGRVLDLGAGRGISSYALARDGWRVDAMEPDPSALVGAGAIRALAEQSALHISVCGRHSEELPFPDTSFDLVHCRQVLHHTRDLTQSCREILRVLKPGGMMVATREHVISKREDLQLFLDSHPLHRFYGGENAYLLKEYVGAIRSAGLSLDLVLAPYDSPINYFPLTDAQVITLCTRPLRGHRFSGLIRFLSSHKALDRALTKALVALHCRRDQTPGRLYSFVASRPRQ